MSELPRVLLLDDEKAVLGVLREVLRRNFEVTIAMEGDEALRKMRTDGPFHIILSDMQMEGMNGIEFLRQANEIDPWSVKMLLTGHGDLRTAMSAVNEGRIFRFLTKPCPPKQLVSAFEDAAEQFERRDQQRRNVIGDKERISRRMVKTQGYALLGRFVDSMSDELRELTKRHGAALDQALATAGSGGFVSTDELGELRAVEHALEEIVKQVLHFVSARSELAPVSLQELVVASLERMKWMQATHVEVTTHFDEDLPKIHVAADIAEQALSNLLQNAYEALRETPGPRIAVHGTFDIESNEVVCEIKDNGPGIHAEVKPFVTRPFFTTHGVQQAGLGLPVAESVIESFDGTLELRSVPGEGASLIVRFPAVFDADTQSDN